MSNTVTSISGAPGSTTWMQQTVQEFFNAINWEDQLAPDILDEAIDYQIAALSEDVTNRYLNDVQLEELRQYVHSLSDRLATYCTVRDYELQVMQIVANQLQSELPQVKIELLERCLKNALFTLRCCAMAMLLNDASRVEQHLLNWLNPIVEAFRTEAIDSRLYSILQEQLASIFSPKQLSLFMPLLALVQNHTFSCDNLFAEKSILIDW